MHKIIYSRRAAKSFKKIPKEHQFRIRDKIENLSQNPRLPGTIKLVDYSVAKFRHRVGNYRILFDIDDGENVIEILDIRKRGEGTYS